MSRRSVPTPKATGHRVVVVGGGFGGLYAARSLGRDGRVALTLVNRRNFHSSGHPLLPEIEVPEPPA